MMAMKRGPIGVWFSVALAVLVFSLWLGSMLGSAVAHYWYGHHQQEQGTLTGPEQIRVRSELAALSTVQMLRLYARVAPEEGKQGDKNLLDEIHGLGNLKRHSNTPEIKSVVDLELGLAYVHAAMAEQQNNNEDLAKKYMQSAQVLFDSLGWRDYSEETLKVVAKREFETWGPPQTKGNQK